MAARARAAAAAAGLGAVEVREGDAATSDVYAGWAPADLVLLCGVLGNLTDGDVESTVRAMPGLCAAGGVVVWTGHRKPPDLTPAVREWFAAAGFVERVSSRRALAAGRSGFTRRPATVQRGLAPLDCVTPRRGARGSLMDP